MRRTKSTSTEPTAGLFLTPEGKLPPFAQRRLNDLLARNQNGALTAVERRELREAVQYVEQKTLLMLTHRRRTVKRATQPSR